jgi:hypothetical protein
MRINKKIITGLIIVIGFALLLFWEALTIGMSPNVYYAQYGNTPSIIDKIKCAKSGGKMTIEKLAEVCTPTTGSGPSTCPPSWSCDCN